MIRHSTKIAAEIAIGLVMMAVVLTLGLVWRLSEAPITLSSLAPYLEEALSDEARGLEARVVDLSLAWDEELRRPELRAFGLSLQDRDGVVMLDLPRADVRVSLLALLEGRLAVEQVDIVGIGLDLERAEDGGISLTSARSPGEDEAAPESDPGGLGNLTFDDWLAEGRLEDGQSIFSSLRRVRIIGARLVLRDKKTGATWRAPRAFIDMRRNDAGVLASLLLKLEIGGELTDLTADANYDQASGRIDATMRFTGMHPSRLAAALPFRELENLQGLDLALNGSLVLSLAPSGEITRAGLELFGGPGQVQVPGVALAPFAIRGFRLEAGVDLVKAAVNLRRLDVMLGEESGPFLTVAGELRGLSGDLFGPQIRDLRTTLDFTLNGMEVESLPFYWPPDLAGNGRDWVLENITAGRVGDLQGKVSLFAPGGRWNEALLESLEGGFSFTGVEAHYLRPMPPVAGIDGEARFSPDELVLTLKGGGTGGGGTGDGGAGGVTLGDGEVTISGLNTPHQSIAIDFAAAGGLHDIFKLLNHPRVALIDKLGLEAEGAVGEGNARARFEFPLIAALTFEEIDVSAKGEFSDVGLGKVLFGQDLSGGNLTLDLGKEGMDISGAAALAEVPLAFEWRENFVPQKGLRRRLEGTLPRVGHEKLRIFGIESAPYLSGPLSGAILYVEQSNGEARVDVDADLAEAAMSIPELANWSKPAGQKGRASFSLNLLHGVPRSLQDVGVASGSLVLSGNAQFDDSGSDIVQARLDSLAFGDQALWDVAVSRRAGSLSLEAGGGILDARPFLEDEEAEPLPDPAGSDVGNDLRVKVGRIEQLRFAEGRYLEDGYLELERLRDGWRRVVLRGRIPEAFRSPGGGEAVPAPEVEVVYGPSADGRQVLRVETRDAGGLFRSLDFFDTMEGGWLRINGMRQAISPDNPLRGDLEIKDFKLIEAPLLARLLTVASLTGIVNVLSGEGIQFKKAVGEFEAVEGRISSDLLRIYGSALGLTAQGKVDIDANQVDLRGTVVPAYAVNQVLGAIPLLGNILTGGKGEGVFAVTYAMTGPLDDPKVSVNPLAALAPGFLRGLFEVGDGSNAEDQPRALPGATDR